MKVYNVNPGAVFAKGGLWYFNVILNNKRENNAQAFCSAAEAKQSMREWIARARRQHGLI